MEDQQVQSRPGCKRVINVGSRKSQLALIQTNLVIDQLNQFYANNAEHLITLGDAYRNGVRFNVISMTTSGDQILDKALPDIGAKSLFTKELENALLDGRVDFVVHSLKDLPTTLPNGCAIGAITKRDDPNDAIVLKRSLRSSIEPLDLIFGTNNPAATKINACKIGTSSHRRIAMLRRCNPSLDCINIRGNLNTRLSKLDDDDGEYAAIILARAGLERMKWSDRVSSSLKPQTDPRLIDWCYAVGQGAIAVECRQHDSDIMNLLAPINDLRTILEVAAERNLMRKLEGGCSVPLGVRSSWSEDATKLILSAIVLSLDGLKTVKASDEVTLSRGEDLDSKSVSDLMSLTTGIIIPGQRARLNLIECSELGVRVALKMINLGCLELMRTNK